MDAFDPHSDILSQMSVDVVDELAVARLLAVIRVAAALYAETTEPACNAEAGILDTKSAPQKIHRWKQLTVRARGARSATLDSLFDLDRNPEE